MSAVLASFQSPRTITETSDNPIGSGPNHIRNLFDSVDCRDPKILRDLSNTRTPPKPNVIASWKATLRLQSSLTYSENTTFQATTDMGGYQGISMPEDKLGFETISDMDTVSSGNVPVEIVVKA